MTHVASHCELWLLLPTTYYVLRTPYRLTTWYPPALLAGYDTSTL